MGSQQKIEQALKLKADEKFAVVEPHLTSMKVGFENEESS